MALGRTAPPLGGRGRARRGAAVAPSVGKYGQLLGTMHALAKQYQPAELAWKSPDGIEDSLPVVERNQPVPEALAVQKYYAVWDYPSTLPQDNASYGVVHYDVRGPNLRIDSAGNISLAKPLRDSA
jgi:Ser/Thr protein kinase RdoA (MazF antagonist)